MKKSFAIYDVDKTIIKGDSMFSFLFYGISKKPWFILYLPIIFFKLVLFKLGVLDVRRAKESLYLPIKYLTEQEVEEFYDKVLAKRVYEDMIKTLEEHKENGLYTILVSASPEEYLKHFKKMNCVDEVIGTKLLKVDGRCVNRIDGENCKAKEKINRIQEFLKQNNFEIDFENSYCYGDSKDDIPMMRLVKNRYRVKKGSLEEL